MIVNLLISIGIIVGLALAWVGVQALWGRTFREYMSGEDAMAGRTKCANCGCTTACENNLKETTIEQTH